ncbi:timeless [Lycorma delicatula]|uniref:timeless n=1 Tax=Lycorma delicatula TaxID=130591 RepID=UPI003F513BAD
MEWMVTNSQLHSTFSLLGSRVGDTYHVSEGCMDNLQEILNKLINEDRVQRPYRRAIGFSQVIKKDLLPLLWSVKNDNRIIDVIVRILGNLTIPIECLLDIDSLLKSDTGRTIIYELNWLLTSCKEAFLDPRSTRAILNYMKLILDKEEFLTAEECEGINNCLLLLRNILHIPEVRGGVPGNGVSHQNQIVWNVFTQNMDKVLIQLMTGSNRAYWGMAVIQLIALMYKDQHVGTLQKLLNLWFEASLSESSEDNESNTSPPDQGSGDSSSSMMMSDPTSDSSDNGGSNDVQHKSSKIEVGESMKSSEMKQGFNSCRIADRKIQSSNRKHFISNKSQGKKERTSEATDVNHFDAKSHHSMWSWTSSEGGTSTSAGTGIVKKECASSELSDCGYGTQVENQESISTSSNEDDAPNRNVKPIHQKPSHLIQKSRYLNGKVMQMLPHEKKEWRRKKLIKRSRTNIMNMKALLHHAPSDEDISHLLKEFTVDFLLKGYAHLVQELQAQLLTNLQPHIDTSHFFWLVTYFLKFAAQLELDLEHISPVLSFDTVAYLTFEGVNLCERLELNRMKVHNDFTPCLRRMHLVVTAIREVIQAVEIYKKLSHLSQEDENHLIELQNKICSTEDLKCLFVLLLRQFDPTIQSKQYLQDIIVTNHMLLIFLENSSKTSCIVPPTFHKTAMSDHISQFASNEIMKQYGLLLECFEENGEFVNNCIFTMMHHVAGDINQAETLFQPSILKTFFKIWESDFEICDDWSDLIEYVVHKFINIKHNLPVNQPENKSDSDSPQETKEGLPVTGWSQDDSRNLHWYYFQSARSSDPIGKVLDHYTESGVLNKTRIGVIEQLLRQEVISDSQFDEFMKKEPDYEGSRDKKAEKEKCKSENEILDEIKVLRDHLVNENKGKFVTWLKHSLLEACYAKLCVFENHEYIVEPVSYHYALLKQSIPLVPWNNEQCNILQYQPFVLLLHKLGMHLPSDTGKVYARIPHFWTAEILYSMAQKLGAINPDELKFDTAELLTNKSNLWLSELDPLLSNSEKPLFTVSCFKETSSFINLTTEHNLKSNWLDIVQVNKTNNTAAPESPPLSEENELASVSSDTDLTRMCVSDEEQVALPEKTT